MTDFVNTVDVIGDEALSDSIIDRSITEIADSYATRIFNYGLANSNLTKATFLAVEKIFTYAFQSCTKLTEVHFPAATTILGQAFYDCYQLTTVDFPIVTSIGEQAFYSCSALLTVVFPVAASVGSSSFYNCNKLHTADFSATVTFAAGCFSGCSKLKALILRNTEQICTLNATNALLSTPIASGTGYIYVPAALIEDYKVATNWSTYANQFRALEDYTVDGTTTGALDETKI